ncbi:hypothetical protein CJ179_39220 [Rhodococcus sp. ACS1]|uniref:helix-turn-helix domain-containing protein n=1 Tax=Rhodococcus sp. ACS1 TaxID=2028570 RepID=UPI000BB12E59|nr:helix-turn-helix domain-containing protein [Rhodococcus sp. ACS1]PBC38620.1 hypothetical protein CJ179_39220 [Rhodococcus sp. ACS1]
MAASRTRESKRIATIITTRRTELGLNRSELARRTGLNPSTIMRLEQGLFARPNPHSLLAIADGLNLPGDNLLAEAGWIAKAKPVTGKPHVRITYQDIPSEVARDIQAAIDAIASSRGIKFDIYHESVSGDDETAA